MSKKKLRPVLLHEVTNAKHRIVSVSLDATVAGEWSELHEFAHLNSTWANAGASKQLPKGLFRVTTVDQQVLGS